MKIRIIHSRSWTLRSVPKVCCLLLLVAAATLGGAPEAANSRPSASENGRSDAQAKVDRWTDAAGNFYRRARTGHVTNYGEDKVGSYTLPELLVTRSGIRVDTGELWRQQRRPELLELYRKEIYGRVPINAPAVAFEVVEMNPQALYGTAIKKVIVARFGDLPDGPKVQLHLYLPSRAKGPVPLLLHLLFGKPPLLGDDGRPPASAKPVEIGPVRDILARGYGYAVFRYTELEPDSATSSPLGVREMARTDKTRAPAGDEWGAIAAWAWGASRMLDYLEKDPDVDGSRIGLIGHSRLGKTVLWAGAQDERFALVFSSCAGEMGSALARRDYGETVDDMAGNFSHQFAANFGKYMGHWTDLPVDAHNLIALHAPRPVLITGGTQDRWADPRGEFLAAVAAEPVYHLLGKKGLETSEFPAADTAVLKGNLGFYCHTGPHAITAEDWTVFLEFADRYFNAPR